MLTFQTLFPIIDKIPVFKEYINKYYKLEEQKSDNDDGDQVKAEALRDLIVLVVKKSQAKDKDEVLQVEGVVSLLGKEFIANIVKYRLTDNVLSDGIPESTWGTHKTYLECIQHVVSEIATLRKNGIIDPIIEETITACSIACADIAELRLALSHLLSSVDLNQQDELRATLKVFLISEIDPCYEVNILTALIRTSAEYDFFLELNLFAFFCNNCTAYYFPDLVKYCETYLTGDTSVEFKNWVFKFILTEFSSERNPTMFGDAVKILNFITAMKVPCFDLIDNVKPTQEQLIISYINFIFKNKSKINVIRDIVSNEAYMIDSNGNGKELLSDKFFIDIAELSDKKLVGSEDDMSCAKIYARSLYYFLDVRKDYGYIPINRAGMIDFYSKEVYATSENQQFLAKMSIFIVCGSQFGKLLKDLYHFRNASVFAPTYRASSFQQAVIRQAFERMIKIERVAQFTGCVLALNLKVNDAPAGVRKIFIDRGNTLNNLALCFEKNPDFHLSFLAWSEHHSQATFAEVSQYIRDAKPKFFTRLSMWFSSGSTASSSASTEEKTYEPLKGYHFMC